MANPNLKPGAGPGLVAVVVVTLNSAAMIARCLAPLRERSRQFYVVIVDNCSRDDTVATIRRLGLADAVICNDTNWGYGSAVNQALGHLKDQKIAPSTVVLLDPDCFIAPGRLLRLATVLSDHPRLGAVSPVLRGGDGTEQVTAHEFRTLRSEARRILAEAGAHRAGLLARELSPNLYLTDWVVGSCLVLRPETLAVIGGIADRYFVYVEDIDTCHRLRTAGWSVAIDTGVSAVHIGGYSLASSAIAGFAPTLKLVNEIDFYESVHHPALRAAIALLRLARQLRTGDVGSRKTVILLLAGVGFTARRIGRLFLRREDMAVRDVIPARWLTRRRPR